MTTLVISDIHLGSPLFVKKNSLIKLLKSTAYDKIILNGDIFDVWEKKFNDILLDNFDIIKTLQVESKIKNIYFIVGNHDSDPEEIKKVFPFITVLNKLIIDDMLFIHGDQFDSMVYKYSRLAKLLYIPHWICQRIFHINIKSIGRKLLNSISNKKNKPYFDELVGTVELESISFYKDQCRYLIMGHTHVPKIIKSDECDYINCGDLIHNNVYLTIDKNKKFNLRNLEE